MTGSEVAARHPTIKVWRHHFAPWAQNAEATALAAARQNFGPADTVRHSPFTDHRSSAPWARHTDPLERLAGFASDNTQPVALRHEAQTVLTLFKKRRDDLDARDEIRDSEVTVLGPSMIVPKKSC